MYTRLPFHPNEAWPIVDGRLLLSLPGQFHALAATGLFASGAEGRTGESAVMAIFGEMARQREKSVASPDEWAEIDIPLAMLAQASAPGRLGRPLCGMGKPGRSKVESRRSKVESREGRALSRPRRKALRQERKPPLAPSP